MTKPAELEKAVGEVRNDEKWREPIMTLEMLINDRLHAAVKEARSEGESGEKRKTVIRMLEAGLPEDSILVATGLTSEEVDQIRKESMQ